MIFLRFNQFLKKKKEVKTLRVIHDRLLLVDEHVVTDRWD